MGSARCSSGYGARCSIGYGAEGSAGCIVPYRPGYSGMFDGRFDRRFDRRFDGRFGVVLDTVVGAVLGVTLGTLQGRTVLGAVLCSVLGAVQDTVSGAVLGCAYWVWCWARRCVHQQRRGSCSSRHSEADGDALAVCAARNACISRRLQACSILQIRSPAFRSPVLSSSFRRIAVFASSSIFG